MNTGALEAGKWPLLHADGFAAPPQGRAADPGLLAGSLSRTASDTSALPAIGLAQPSPAATMMVEHVRLIDGRGGAPVDEASLLIQDGRIVAAGVGVPKVAHSPRASCAGRVWIEAGT